MGLFSRNSEQARKDKERTQLLKKLREAAEAGDLRHASAYLLNLSTGGHLETPETALGVRGAIEIMSRRSPGDGISFAIYALGMVQGKLQGETRDLLAHKALSLIARADRTDMKQMAGVAMLAQLVAHAYPDDSETGMRAQAEWQSAFDTLAADKTQGIQYAFAAASNAALSWNIVNSMHVRAMRAWDTAVDDLAAANRPAAVKEAVRVADGYEEFGDLAMPFRKTAMARLRKLNP